MRQLQIKISRQTKSLDESDRIMMIFFNESRCFKRPVFTDMSAVQGQNRETKMKYEKSMGINVSVIYQSFNLSIAFIYDRVVIFPGSVSLWQRGGARLVPSQYRL